MDYKLSLNFYYVDGSEQSITVNTDSVEMAEKDYKHRVTKNEWIEIEGDNGDKTLIQTRNIVNVTFKKV